MEKSPIPIRNFEDGFVPASRSRDIAVGGGGANLNVLLEINVIQQKVMEAAIAENLDVEIENLSIMTQSPTGEVYREAFAGTADSFASNFPNDDIRVFKTQMNRVIGYFTRQGYEIRREDIPSSGLMKWIVRW